VLYAAVYISRFIPVLFSEAYLPYDRSGDWLYRLTEGIGVLTILCLFKAMKNYRYTYYSFTVRFA
jgi:hypothetical protein